MGKRQLAVRIPEELHRRVKSEVALQGTTLTAVVQELLEHWVEGDPPKPKEGGKSS